jgi:hypothetical protein
VHGLLICSAAGRQTVNRSSYIASAGTLSRYDRSAVLRVMHELSAGFSERLDESPPATEIQRFQEVDACMDVQKAVLSLSERSESVSSVSLECHLFTSAKERRSIWKVVKPDGRLPPLA